MPFDLMTAAKRLLIPSQRLVMSWWRRQSPSRQDRFATLGPLVSVLLFLTAIITAFWYLRNEEIERESEAVKRDAEVAQQQIRLRLIENQEQLVRIARELMAHQIDVSEFVAQAGAFSRDRPEITHVSWIAAHRTLRSSVSGAGFQADNLVDPDSDDPSMPAEGTNGIPNAPEVAFDMARERHQVVYSPSFNDNIGTAVFQVQVPLIERGSFTGVLVAEYSIEGLLRYYVPSEVGIRHPINVINAREQTLASTVTPMPGQKPRKAAVIYDVPLAPAVNGLVLRVEGYRTSVGLIGNTLFWMVVALSWLTVWMLLGTWKHMRRRLQIQNALINETNFRRAMENSMLTGMRAMDMDSRISYVNPAFCAMTGFSEAELIGRKPPFPYWPLDRFEENSRLLQQEVQGRSPAGGVEVKVMRRDGSIFDARMYVSPLIDPKGKQTGWMTSMTNITEAKRVRDQLSASHERFTTVLEGLDAAVSVLSVQENEGLFANRSYRLWFGADTGGHALLAGSQLSLPPGADPVDEYSGIPSQHATEQFNEFGSDPREVFVESLDMWFDVRARYLQWTDGRLAQMLIATDITARRRAEELQARQAERAQVTSRLMTMGEMASSVAHELNQPLTAITNYCNGMVYRVRDDNIKREDLLVALEKTAKQAQRAGQIIHRIRNFVKRSEPQRQSSHAYDIVEDAVELAGIELRRRGVAIHSYVAQRLPALMVDPILIEQVLMNLLKNAAEAIDNANLPVSRRHIELRVIPKHTPELGGHVEFSVTDMGPGLPEEVIARMYEAFFSTKADGLGIGLGLCRSIVESHQGRIKAENLYNGPTVVGCRFAFTIPVDIPRAESSGTALNTAATQ